MNRKYTKYNVHQCSHRKFWVGGLFVGRLLFASSLIKHSFSALKSLKFSVAEAKCRRKDKNYASKRSKMACFLKFERSNWLFTLPNRGFKRDLCLTERINESSLVTANNEPEPELDRVPLHLA